MDKPKGVAWDLDGVIVDSAEAHNASWVAMATEFDVPYDPEKDFPIIFGRHNSDIINSLWGVTDAEVIEQMAHTKEAYFRRAATRLRPSPGVVELMEALRRAGWKQGIGTSAPMENIRVVLEATGLADKIDGMASGDDVTRGKPDPEVFLLTFQRIGVEPSCGVVIEDAPAGVEAGKRAGAVCIALAATNGEEALRKAGADIVVRDLTGLSVDDFEKLIAGR